MSDKPVIEAANQLAALHASNYLVDCTTLHIPWTNAAVACETLVAVVVTSALRLAGGRDWTEAEKLHWCDIVAESIHDGAHSRIVEMVRRYG
jgi:hypothetical protein